MIEHILVIASFFMVTTRNPPVPSVPPVPKFAEAAEETMSRGSALGVGHKVQFDLDDWRCYCGEKLLRFQAAHEDARPPWITLENRTTFRPGCFAVMQFVCGREHTTALMLGPRVLPTDICAREAGL